MKETDNNMSIRPPRADVGQGSQTTSTRVSSTSGSVSAPSQPNNNVSGDTVTLTGSVDQMAKLQELLASIPEVDSARVETIKAAIAEGSYKIDPDKIVNNLLQIEKDLS